MKRRTLFALAGASALALAACSPMSQPDIVEVAASDDQFSTLVAAVTAAGLVDTLKGDGPFTVFAPTNAAFAKLPAGTVESLLLPENKDKLTEILTYHVVPGEIRAADITGPVRVATVNGEALHVRPKNGGVRVNDARVQIANVGASNGVIHVIDTVLLP